MNKGAIIIGNNMVYEPWFGSIEVIGSGWDGVENLATPQLSPVASYEAQVGPVGVEMRSISGVPPVLPNVFALLGTDVGGGPNGGSAHHITLEYDQGSWASTSSYSVYELAAPNSPRHLIVVLHSDIEAVGWRLRWEGNNAARSIGSFFVGRSITSPSLADQGWRQRYVDAAAKTVSEGGQIYAASPSITREVRIPMDTLDHMSMFGIPEHGSLIKLRSPTFSHDMVQSGDWWQVKDAEQGSATLSGVMTPSKHYRIDYNANHRGEPYADGRFWVANASATSLGALRTGKGSLVVEAKKADLVIEATSQPGTTRFKIERFSEVEIPQLTWTTGIERNLQHLLSSHGHSRPIIAMMRPSDPLLNQATGIYGYINQPVDLIDRAGARIGTELVIREQR